jgi:hypothetical protein
MKLLAGLVLAQAAAVEPCQYEELINFECHTNSAFLSIRQPLEEADIPQGCTELVSEASRISTEKGISMDHALTQLVTDHRLYIHHIGESEDDKCAVWDGSNLDGEINFADTCVHDDNGIIKGNLYLHEVINGEEISIDQPVSFSCSPSTLTIVSTVYKTMDDVTTHAGLHKDIDAPHSYIKIFDLSTGEEARVIQRGHHYQAVVSLGDELYSGLEMNVAECVVEDQNGLVDEVIIDNEMAEGFNNNVEVGELDGRIKSYMTISEETNFPFYFNGFGRKGASSFQIICSVTIDPVNSATERVPVGPTGLY